MQYLLEHILRASGGCAVPDLRDASAVGELWGAAGCCAEEEAEEGQGEGEEDGDTGWGIIGMNEVG